MAITVGAPGHVIPPVETLLHTAKRSEERGIDVLWWPDHLMGWHPSSIWTPDVCPLAEVQPNPHTYLEPTLAIAAAAGATSTIRLGTSVTEAVRNHPAELARRWLTLDHLTQGRAIFGIGAGEGENITPYGIGFERPVERLEDALRVIRLLWEHDVPVDYRGPVFTLQGAVCGMGAFGGTFPPIWVAAHGPRMCRITGELADGWLPITMDIATYTDRLALIRQAASAAGRSPDAFTPGMWGYVVVTEDHEASHRVLAHRAVKAFLLALPHATFERYGVGHPLGEGVYGLTEYIPERLGREEALAAIDAIPDELAHDAVLHGTPDDLADKLKPYVDAGLRHMGLWNVTFFADLGLIGPSFRLIAEAAEQIRALSP